MEFFGKNKRRTKTKNPLEQGFFMKVNEQIRYFFSKLSQIHYEDVLFSFFSVISFQI